MSPDPVTPAAVATSSTLDDVTSDGVAPAAGPTPAGLPELTSGWLAGAWALVLLAMALAIGGFANSFTAVRDAVEPSFGSIAWTVPVLIDVGVAVFSGIDLLFTRLGMRLWWLRLVPWALIGATIWLNVADETTSVGVVAHAAPPILWVMSWNWPPTPCEPAPASTQKRLSAAERRVTWTRCGRPGAPSRRAPVSRA